MTRSWRGRRGCSRLAPSISPDSDDGRVLIVEDDMSNPENSWSIRTERAVDEEVANSVLMNQDLQSAGVSVVHDGVIQLLTVDEVRTRRGPGSRRDGIRV